MLDNSIIGADPVGIFITLNDTMFLAARGLGQVQMWLNGSTTPTRVFNTSSNAPTDVFVTRSGDIYVDNGFSQQSVDRWTLNTTTPSTAMFVSSMCFGLFVDVNDNLYCSLDTPQQVVKRSLNGLLNRTTIVAGKGTGGNTSDMLNGSRGIFVDRNLDLYVADCYNDRVQRFLDGESNGTTVAGNGATGTMPLHLPADVILDADGHLFIVEYGNHRIVASGTYGFRCIVGCTGASGTTPDKLNNPASLSFGSVGDLFVTDGSNGRVQRFLIARNFCGEL